jgi:hypothetical protein
MRDCGVLIVSGKSTLEVGVGRAGEGHAADAAPAKPFSQA